MIKDVNVSHTITATQNDEGKFVLNSPVELIPKEVAEQLMDMAAEAAIQKLIATDAKGITTQLMQEEMGRRYSFELKAWKAFAWAALAIIIALILKIKGVI